MKVKIVSMSLFGGEEYFFYEQAGGGILEKTQ